MLTVSGLARSILESCITKTNPHLSEHVKLFIGLQNGAEVAVVVGLPVCFTAFVTTLRNICAPAGADQSKIIP